MGKGGSRSGAGRPASHVKAEHCRRIEAGRWAREGLFSPGRTGTWSWWNADSGERTASIGYRGEGQAVALNFTVDGRSVHQFIAELQTACNFGGSRSWFACPRCRRRVGVLFLRSAAGFICRHCGRVTYGSQSDDEVGRSWRKQQKAERRLGGEGWMRPKGMHQTTRDRLTAIIIECEERRDNALAAFVAKHFPGGLTRW
ncbi:hypothetical protein [Pelomonas sp. Root1444]|uniref:hypothetical protein n=1 Tax=Pelomonas sp. Root1444 TaxID=1736464 RepID=UPI000A733813|nr:hypothetical protein [Pelomonas sp. Root1444]